MHWKFKYYGKLGAQKVLGGVPGLYRVQEAVKLATGRLEGRIDTAFVERRFEDKVGQFLAAAVPVPRVVLEQGTGWHGADLVLFHLAGAERTLTYDVRPWLREDLVRAISADAERHVRTLARWSGDPDGVASRARDLSAAAADPHCDLARHLGYEYRVTASMDRSEVPESSVDLFYSDSVLQRATPTDLLRLLQEARRALAPGGFAHHVVDCKDFHAIDDPRIPELGYLRPSARTWSLVTSRYLNYQNRLRLPHFVGLFAQAGFECRTLAERRLDENLALVERELTDHPLWSRLERRDVAVSRFELVGRSAASAAALGQEVAPHAERDARPLEARHAQLAGDA